MYGYGLSADAPRLGLQAHDAMGFPRATALFTLAVFATASRMASAGLMPWPININAMPANCGYVVQVQSGDTCQKLA